MYRYRIFFHTLLISHFFLAAACTGHDDIKKDMRDSVHKEGEKLKKELTDRFKEEFKSMLQQDLSTILDQYIASKLQLMNNTADPSAAVRLEDVFSLLLTSSLAASQPQPNQVTTQNDDGDSIGFVPEMVEESEVEERKSEESEVEERKSEESEVEEMKGDGFDSIY